jgi:hypothetical protein
MPIDAYATAPWYVEHIAPIWRALGDQAGRFHVGRIAMQAAHGLAGVTTMPVGGGGNPILTVAYGDMAAARRMGRTHIALGQHGAGQSYLGAGGARNPSYPGGSHQDCVGLFLCPNETSARLTREAYPTARVEIVGCPKLDALPPHRPSPNGTVVAISCHWDARVAPESGSAWPHFRTALLRLARTYSVIGHGHPRAIARMGPYYRAARIEVVPSFAQVLERASVFVCDNSSSLFEFAATWRPVVVLNSPAYRRQVDHGLRFWSAAGVGINVDGPRELDAAVARSLELRPQDVAAREQALDLVYQPRTGSAAIAAAALQGWASTI